MLYLSAEKYSFLKQFIIYEGTINDKKIEEMYPIDLKTDLQINLKYSTTNEKISVYNILFMSFDLLLRIYCGLLNPEKIGVKNFWFIENNSQTFTKNGNSDLKRQIEMADPIMLPIVVFEDEVKQIEFIKETIYVIEMKSRKEMLKYVELNDNKTLNNSTSNDNDKKNELLKLIIIYLKTPDK